MVFASAPGRASGPQGKVNAAERQPSPQVPPRRPCFPAGFASTPGRGPRDSADVASNDKQQVTTSSQKSPRATILSFCSRRARLQGGSAQVAAGLSGQSAVDHDGWVQNSQTRLRDSASPRLTTGSMAVRVCKVFFRETAATAAQSSCGHAFSLKREGRHAPSRPSPRGKQRLASPERTAPARPLRQCPSSRAALDSNSDRPAAQGRGSLGTRWRCLTREARQHGHGFEVPDRSLLGCRWFRFNRDGLGKGVSVVLVQWPNHSLS